MILFSAGVLLSCGSSKKVVAKKKNTTTTVSKKPTNLRDLESDFSGSNSKVVQNLIKDAKKYLGAPYRYAGNTPAGFDCSGLVSRVFDENNMKLPRRSSDIALEGKRIDISDTKPGDLLFFATSGGTRVSHVGMISDIASDGEISFIHSSTSKGVIISSLNEKYWNNAFLFARRVL